MLVPVLVDEGSSERAGRIHAGTGVLHHTQMAQRYGETDGQRGHESGVRFVLIAHAKHAQHQDETEEELDAQSLHVLDVFLESGVSQAVLVRFRQESLEGGRSGNGSGTLRNHVQSGAYEAHLAGSEQTGGDRWVDVTAADVANGLEVRKLLVFVIMLCFINHKKNCFDEKLCKTLMAIKVYIRRIQTHLDWIGHRSGPGPF